MRILRVPDAGTPGPPPDTENKKSYGEVVEAEILIGGCHRELNFRPGTENGQIETTRTLIRQVPFNKMDLLASCWGKPHLEATLYTEAAPERVEKLTEASFDMVIREGRRLNFTLLQKWLSYQMGAVSAMGQTDLMEKIMQKIMADKPPA